jgi:hypothetical protein
MRGAANADALVSQNVNRSICVESKGVPPVGAQIHFMMAIRNAQRLREFARS